MTARYHSPLPAKESLVLITNPHALISTLWADLPLICDIFNTVKIKRCVWNETNIYCPWVPVGPSRRRSLQLWMAEEKLFLQSEMKSGSREARLNPKHKVWGREWSNQPLPKKVMQNHWLLSWRSPMRAVLWFSWRQHQGLVSILQVGLNLVLALGNRVTHPICSSRLLQEPKLGLFLHQLMESLPAHLQHRTPHSEGNYSGLFSVLSDGQTIACSIPDDKGAQISWWCLCSGQVKSRWLHPASDQLQRATDQKELPSPCTILIALLCSYLVLPHQDLPPQLVTFVALSALFCWCERHLNFAVFVLLLLLKPSCCTANEIRAQGVHCSRRA